MGEQADLAIGLTPMPGSRKRSRPLGVLTAARQPLEPVPVADVEEYRYLHACGAS